MPEIECDVVTATDMVSGAAHAPVFETTVAQKYYQQHHHQQHQQQHLHQHHQLQQQSYPQVHYSAGVGGGGGDYKLLEQQQLQQAQAVQTQYKMATSSYVYRNPLTIPPTAASVAMYETNNPSSNNNNTTSTTNNNVAETYSNNYHPMHHTISALTSHSPATTPASVSPSTTSSTVMATGAEDALAAANHSGTQPMHNSKEKTSEMTFLQKSLEAPPNSKNINYSNGYGGTVRDVTPVGGDRSAANFVGGAVANKTLMSSPPPIGVQAKTPQMRQNLSPTASTEAHLTSTNMAAPATWHPHVYARPPTRPTPHTIADILGLRDLSVGGAVSNNNTTTMIHNLSTATNLPGIASVNALISRDAHDESSNSSVTSHLPPAPAKSPKTILRNFQQQYSQQITQYEQQNLARSASASDTSEDDNVGSIVVRGPSASSGGGAATPMPASNISTSDELVHDQPLNLCVAKKTRDSLSPPPAVKQNQILGVNSVEREKSVLSKHLKKGKFRR